jgi:signal peptidase II
VTARRSPHWLLFVGLALAVVVADQLTKAWVVGAVAMGDALRLVGDYLRLIITYNTGGLFGLFQQQSAVFAIFSLAVMALIVVVHGRTARSRYITLTLGLLLGGAIGNFIDRIQLGHVVDWVDIGVGDWRFYTFNVADMAVTASVLLLLFLSVRASLAGGDQADHRDPDGAGA